MDKELLKKINHEHVHSVDKFYRMHSGLSSSLTDYKDETIYLAIHISPRWPKDASTTAQQLAECWKTFNTELFAAKYYCVHIYSINGDTGFVISFNTPPNDKLLKEQISQFNRGIQELHELKNGIMVKGNFLLKLRIKIKDNTMEATNIHIDYIEEDQLKIVFTTLVIRVKSINKYFGSLHDFCTKYDIRGVTNGKLFVKADMMEPSGYLNEIIDEYLIPLGFTYKEDCVILYEQLTQGVERNKERHHDYVHPQTYDIKWLGSLVTQKGNFVWEVNYEELEDND